jgi:hypothetical protein
MSEIVNLINIATKINDLTYEQLLEVAKYTKAVGFNVSNPENTGEWAFYSEYYGELPMISIYYSPSKVTYGIPSARLRVGIQELLIGMQAFGDFVKYINQAEGITKMIVEAGGLLKEGGLYVEHDKSQQ